jgi:hypothetical protein
MGNVKQSKVLYGNLYKILLLVLFILPTSLFSQSFTYSYLDPCTKGMKTVYADMNSPIVIVYYGQAKTFSYQDLQTGNLEIWMNDLYNKYKTTSPCQGAIITTTTTTTTNTTMNIVGSVMNLTSMDFSSVANVGSTVNVGSTTSAGTNVGEGSSDKSNNSEQKTEVKNDGNNSSGDQSTNGNSSNNGGSNGSNSGGGTNGGNQGKGSETPKEQKTEKPDEQKVEEQKTEQNKTTSNSAAKSTSKAKAEVAKPAILVTGDIVGIQTKSDGAQDARATMSFTRVKGDGTSSLGGSVDYMVNSKIGNFSLMKSWMGIKQNGNKHINVVSGSASLLPGAWSSTALFVRVNSIKSFTALYGCAGSYGIMYEEPLISTLVIGGFMYKGKLTKKIDATIIAAGVYAPYMKYYTESLFKNKPIIIPFINVAYKMTKSFAFGLTGGGTYVANQDIINFQILMGAKLLL